MKKLFIIANWKSNKTAQQAEEWFAEINSYKQLVNNKSSRQIIICPPFTLLAKIKSYIIDNKLPIALGGQDISPFDEGEHTGEVNGKQIKEFADYVIIGHSERRREFGETEEILTKKVEMANKSGLTPVFCIQDEQTPILQGVTIVAYEPPSAIGAGHSDTPENANKIANIVKEKYNLLHVLYGGSVDAENAGKFLEMSSIDGVLVGGASLDAKEFAKIITAT